jgi:hypothetical protein
MSRRFPPPWSVEELDLRFVVKDHADQKLAYVYFEDEPWRQSAAKLLAKDEARRIAIWGSPRGYYAERNLGRSQWTTQLAGECSSVSCSPSNPILIADAADLSIHKIYLEHLCR